MRGWRRRLIPDRAKTLRGASYYIKLLLHLRDFENFDFGGTYGGQIDFGGPKPKNPIRPIVFPIGSPIGNLVPKSRFCLFSALRWTYTKVLGAKRFRNFLE